MTKSNILRISIATLILTMLEMGMSLTAQNVTLPYFCGFEDASENAQWVLNAGTAGNTATNKWYISDAEVYAGDSALNISNTLGQTATYADTTIAIVAYRTITLPAGTYDLSFTYYAGGENRYDGLYACWVNGTQTTNSSDISTPSWVNSTAFTINTMKMQKLTGGWKVATQSITTTGAAMKLVFVWVNNDSISIPPGGCIDNIQICSTGCYKPTNLTAIANGQSINVTWSGTANSYDLMYRSYGSPTVTSITGITGNSYTINGVGEGVYDIMVRADCPYDTSIYVTTQGVVVYDSTAHCINYVNLTATGTQCTYGSYSNPYQNNGCIDNGPSVGSSRHTVHYIYGETDPRTSNGLTTIPKGEVMSVRLGNWNDGSEGEAITYSYNVPTINAPIILIKYAVVFEDPGHDEPPEFDIELLDSNKQPLSLPCSQNNVLCNGYSQGWHTYSGYDTIIWWKEWSIVGFNLSQYAGQTIKIRLTTKDCNYGEHFGYAYFTIGCINAEIEYASNEIKAPDGFDYSWRNDCSGQIISTSQKLSISDTDTCSYSCTCSFKDNTNCSFTQTVYPTALYRYTLSLTSNDTTKGTVSGAGNYRFNQTTTLIATPNNNCIFTHWSNGDTSRIITINVISDTLLTAYFEKVETYYTVNTNLNYSNRGTVTGGGAYACGSYATLTATPNPDYIFTHWSNGDTSCVSNIEVMCDTTMTAYFEPIGNSEGTDVDNTDVEYRITLIPNPINAGSTATIYGDFSELKSVEIVNSFGQVTTTFRPSAYPVTIPAISTPGIYHLRIITTDGRRYLTKLVVI